LTTLALLNHKPSEPEAEPIVETAAQGPDGFNLTPMGNTERFLRDFGIDIRWIEGKGMNSAGTFYLWNGSRWQPNNAEVLRCAQATARKLGELIQMGMELNYSRKEMEELLRFWKNSEADYKVREIVALARSHVVIDRADFDSDVELLGVQNGVVDLRDGSFRKPDREDLITKQANVSFDPAATCPTWDSFLLETTRNDLELVRYLQQCVGITLTGNQKEHLFFIIVGQGGTDKTTFCEALKFMFGGYSCGIDPNSLGAGKVEGGRARPDLAKLHGVHARLVSTT